MYVNYCKNKPDSTQLILEHAGGYFDVSWMFLLWIMYFINFDRSSFLPVSGQFESQFVKVCVLKFLLQEIQQRHRLANSISSYLIKPVQRITKYQLLLKVKTSRIHPKLTEWFDCNHLKIIRFAFVGAPDVLRGRQRWNQRWPGGYAQCSQESKWRHALEHAWWWVDAHRHTKTHMDGADETVSDDSECLQGLTRTLSPRENWSCRMRSRCGIPRPWSVRDGNVTCSSLKCHWFSARRLKTLMAGASTSTRASFL